MDKLELKIKENNAGQAVEVEIYVNGKHLIDLLKEFELPYALSEWHPDIAGSYMGLTPGELHQELSDPGNIMTILGCLACGMAECWPIRVKVVNNGDNVEWKEFKQPYREKWDYSSFSTFKFNKKEYMNEMNKISDYVQNFT